MDQLFTYQFLGFFQAECSTALAILGIGTIYLLVPVLGYEPSRRSPLAAAMWALILKIGIGLFRTSLILLNLMENNGAFVSYPRTVVRGAPLWDLQQTVMIVLTPAESAVFMGAMILFVYGLQRLRRRPQPFPG